MFAIVKDVDKTDISGLDRAGLGRAVAEGRETIRQGLLDSLPAAGRLDRDRLRWILKADRAELWRSEGARNMAQWLSALFHISNWKARRWIGAAYALEELPLTSAALEIGSLSLDKIVELTRFATPADEKKLVKWARQVTVATIRTRGDEEQKRNALEAEEAHRARYLRAQRWDDHIEIDALLTLDQGAALLEAVDQLAHELPRHPDEDSALPGFEEVSMEQRRADALVLLATRAGTDGGAQTTVVLHAPIEALAHDEGGCTLEGGGVLHPETARRLACDARLQVVLEGKDGNPLGIGRISQMTPPWLRGQVFHRDGDTCTFPGCESKTFLHPHHVQHWGRQGPTDLDNLITVCTFHHTLLHEGRWSVTFDSAERPIWFRPGGRVYEPGSAPPDPPEPMRELPTIAEAAGYSRLFDLVYPRQRPPSRRRRDPLVALARKREERLPYWGREQLGLV
jgi:hypothetical protein